MFITCLVSIGDLVQFFENVEVYWFLSLFIDFNAILSPFLTCFDGKWTSTMNTEIYGIGGSEFLYSLGFTISVLQLLLYWFIKSALQCLCSNSYCTYCKIDGLNLLDWCCIFVGIELWLIEECQVIVISSPRLWLLIACKFCSLNLSIVLNFHE